MASILPPLRHLYFDPVVLAYLGSDDVAANCLSPVFTDLRRGQCDLISTLVSPNIFAVEACGLRLYIVYAPDRTEAEITGYTFLPEVSL